jgi:hypothetical protein
MQDLRSWLKETERLGLLRRIEGADWNLDLTTLKTTQRDTGF